MGPDDKERLLFVDDPLTGPAGTEVLIVCARRSAPIGIDDVRAVLPDLDAWPHLPVQSVLRIAGDKVEVLGGERSLGNPNDPTGAVRQRMETMLKSLRSRFQGSGAIAFPHLETLPR